jgi:Transposase domain (DUF772)
MLRLVGGQVESLLDELLPVEVRELPADLAVLDRLLAEPRLLAPIEQAWEWTARRHGRPTIPMGCLVRLMVSQQRTGWGYQTLVREVSDSLHLGRFCLLPLTQRVPDESTVEADIRYPTDAGLAWQGARALAREGRKLAGRLRGQSWTAPGSSARRYGRSPEPWPGAPASDETRSWS